jgi:hypothetical protein
MGGDKGMSNIEQIKNQLKDQQVEINGLWKTLYSLTYDVKRLEQKDSRRIRNQVEKNNARLTARG